MYSNDFAIQFFSSKSISTDMMDIKSQCNTHCVVLIQLPVIIHLSNRWFWMNTKLREMNPFSRQLAQVVQWPMRLHLTVTIQNSLPNLCPARCYVTTKVPTPEAQGNTY